jgi:ATP synthase protein I
MLTRDNNDKVFITLKNIFIPLIFRKIGLLSEDYKFMRQNQRHPLQAIGLMSAIASQLVGSILVGIFGGRWIDRQFDTEPLFLIIGLLLGLATGVYAMLRTVRQYFSGD